MLARGAHPVLSVDEAKAFEAALFAGDEASEWKAMQRAGRAVAEAVRADFRELGEWPLAPRILVLAGKGHNGGDALIAAKVLLEQSPAARAVVWLGFAEREVKPLALRAYRELVAAAADRIDLWNGREGLGELDVVLDGVFGFQFRTPLASRAAAVFQAVNARAIRLRAAIDLPSGLGAPAGFRADFTYATGSVKAPVLAHEHAGQVGRLRYLDLGFFADRAHDRGKTGQYVLTTEVLAPLRGLRATESDKRSYGHVAVIGGSRAYPGAVMMAALGALRSGAGLVTAFVPASLAAAFAAHAPEIMWVGLSETPDGGIALDGLIEIKARLGRADALVIGPGLAREAETFALVEEVLKGAMLPVVLDADALQTALIRRAAGRPLVLTPHAGEFARIAGEGAALRDYAQQARAVTLLKGRITSLSDGAEVYHVPFGGPVLARGGSGDILAGMIGTQLAQTSTEPPAAAARALVWHGAAADLLAREHGQVAVRTTQLLDYLSAVLRS